MNVVNTIRFSIVCLSLMIFSAVQAQENEVENKHLYIGITKDRTPYTQLDDKNKPKGALLKIIDELCQKIDVQCTYTTGKPDQLLRDLQGYKLHAVVTLDSRMALPDEQFQLTTPICHIRPVFIQRLNNATADPKDLEGKTIGVKENTSLHQYLMDKYGNSATLRPYLTLENGVFDLVSERVDAVFADKAFYKFRVAPTSLANEANPERIITHEININEIPKTSMALVIREQDKELLLMLEQAIQGNGQARHCDCLLDKKLLKKGTTEKAVSNN